MYLQGCKAQLLGLCGSFLLITAVSKPASADSNVTGSVTGMTTYTAASGFQTALVFVSPALPLGTEGCTETQTNEIWIDLSDVQGKTVYATVLAAYLAGQAMSFGVRGCAENGMVPVVYSVHLGT